MPVRHLTWMLCLLWCAGSARGQVGSLGTAFVRASPSDGGPFCLAEGPEVELGLNDVVGLDPRGGTITWYRGSDADFDPETAGTPVGSAITILPSPASGVDPELIAVKADGCNGDADQDTPGATDVNELALIYSGEGFDAGALEFDFDYVDDDPDDPQNDDLGPNGNCPFRPAAEINVQVDGTCVRYADASTLIPPRAIVLVFPSALADQRVNAEPLNVIGYPVYVLQSSCDRDVKGVFPNRPTPPVRIPVDFGAGLDNSFMYNTLDDYLGDDLSGWTFGVSKSLRTACGEVPAAEIDAEISAGPRSDEVSFATHTLQPEDCGTVYYRAVFEADGSGCTPPPSAAVEVSVACPRVELPADEQICEGDPFPTLSGNYFDGVGPDLAVDLTLPSNLTSTLSPDLASGQFELDPPAAVEPGTYRYEVTTRPPQIRCTLFGNLVTEVDVLPSTDAACVNTAVADDLNPRDTTICDDGKLLALTGLEDPSAPGGSWSDPSGAGLVGLSSGGQWQFDIGESGTGDFDITYTVTDDDGTRTGTATVSVVSDLLYGDLPEFTQPVCPGEQIDLQDYLPDDAPPGTWTSTPAGFVNADGTTLEIPVDASETSITISFEPDIEIFCAEQKDPLTVQIAPADGTTAADAPPPACLGSVYDLEQLLAPGSTLSGVWEGTGVTGSSLDVPADATGSISVTYRPADDGAACFGPLGFEVQVAASVQLPGKTESVCLGGPPFFISSLYPDGTVPAGRWTGQGVADDGLTFDPSDAPTTSPLTLTFVGDDGCTTGSLSISLLPGSSSGDVLTTNEFEVCVGELDFDLEQFLLDPTSTGEWRLGDQVIPGGVIDEIVETEPYDVVFVPIGGNCAEPETLTLTPLQSEPATLAVSVCADQLEINLDDELRIEGFVPIDYPADPDVVGGILVVGDLNEERTIRASVQRDDDSCLDRVDITVTPGGAVLPPLDTTICARPAPVAIVELTGPAYAGGGWFDASGAEVTEVDLSQTGTQSFTYDRASDAGLCDVAGTLDVTVVASVATAPITDQVCADTDVPLAAYLPDGAPDPDYVLTEGTGTIVDGVLNTVGASLGEVLVVEVSFPGDDICYEPFTLTLDVAPGEPVVEPVYPYCPGQAFALDDLVLDPADLGGTWTDESGNPVEAFAPSEPGEIVLRYSLPGESAACGGLTTTITVKIPTPAAPLPVSVCAGDQVDLTAFLPPDLAGASLVFSPPATPGGVFDAGGLAAGAGSSVLAEAADESPYCGQVAFEITVVGSSGGPGPVLPDEDVCGAVDLDELYGLDPAAGSWSGAPAGGSSLPPEPGSYALTYTPAGGCGAPQDVVVTVAEASRPVRLQACGGDLVDLLAEAPAGANPVFDPLEVPDPRALETADLEGLVRFTASVDPGAGYCGDTLVYELTVRAIQPVEALSSVVCSLSLPVSLLQFEDPAYPGGTWSIADDWPAGRDSSSLVGPNRFTAIASGDYLLTYAPEVPPGSCLRPDTVTLTVTAAQPSPVLAANTCAGGLVDLTELAEAFPTPLGAVVFPDGPNVAGNVFTAPADTGLYTIRALPNPSGGACAAEAIARIRVTESVATFVERIPPLCPGEDPLDLDAFLVDPAPAGSWEQSAYVQGSTFDPAAAPPDSARVAYRVADGLCARDTFVTVYLGGGATATIPDGRVCERRGEIVLSDFFAAANLPPGRWLLGSEELSGDSLEVAGRAGTTLALVFEPAGECGQPTEVALAVTDPVQVDLRPGSACSGAGPRDLTQLIEGDALTGTWTSPSGAVGGSLFDPTGLPNGEYEVTFTPDDPCGLPTSTSVTVGFSIQPNLRTDTVCAGGTLPLARLLDPDFPDGTWSGPGVVDGTTFDAREPGVRTGLNEITFEASGACGAAAPAYVRVQEAVRPNLKRDQICRDNDGVYDLTQLQDPNFPNGEWSSPAGYSVTGGEIILAEFVNDPGPLRFTFAPTASCTAPATTEIEFLSEITPVLKTATICATTTDFPLSSLTDPRFPEGSWNGLGGAESGFFDATTVVNPGTEETFVLYFKPEAKCGAFARTEILIRNEVVVAARDSSFCRSAQPFDLTELLEFPIPGTWSVGNVFDPADLAAGQQLTTSFTPADEGCYQAAEITLSRGGSTPLGLQDQTFCSQPDPLDLRSLLTDPGSGSFIVDGQERLTVSRDVLRDTTYEIRYVPADTCALTEEFLVNVARAAEPVLVNRVACGSAAFPLDSFFVADPAAGTWRGPGIADGLVDVASLTPDSYTYTFTPGGGSACAKTAEVELAITAAGSTGLLADSTALCAGGAPLDLNEFLPAGAVGQWRGAGVTPGGDTFDPTGLPADGRYELGFVPKAGSCLAPAEFVVNLAAGGTLPAIDSSLCLAEDVTAVALGPFEPAGQSGGSWAVAGVPLPQNELPVDAQLRAGVVLRYETTGDCAASLDLSLAANLPQIVRLGADTVCPGAAELPLSAFEPSGFEGGTWTLGGVEVNAVDVSSVGTYAYAYRLPPGRCAQVEGDLTISVSSSAGLGIADATLCLFDDPRQLDGLLPAGAPAGAWTLNGVPATQIDPAALGAGDYAAVYTLSEPGECGSADTAMVVIESGGIPELSGGVACARDSTYDLRQLLSPGSPRGEWFAGSEPLTDGVFDARQYEPGTSVAVYFVPSSDCGGIDGSTLPTTVRVEPATALVQALDSCVNALTTTPTIDLGGLLIDPDGSRAAPTPGVWTLRGGLDEVIADGLLRVADYPTLGELSAEFAPTGDACAAPTTATLTFSGGSVVLDTLVVCRDERAVSLAELDATLPTGVDPGIWLEGDTELAGGLPLAGVEEVILLRRRSAEAVCDEGFVLPVRVTSARSVAFRDIEFCAAGTPIADLDLLLAGQYGPGVWTSGNPRVAVSPGGAAELTGLAPGTYPVTFAPDAGCIPPATGGLVVAEELDYRLDRDTICAGGGPADLNALLTPPPPVPGRWEPSDEITVEGILRGSDRTTRIPVVYIPHPDACAAQAAIPLTVNRVQRPFVAVDSFVCDDVGRTYTAYASVDVGTEDYTISTDLGFVKASSLLVIPGLLSGAPNAATVTVSGSCGEVLPLELRFDCDAQLLIEIEETIADTLCADAEFAFRGLVFDAANPSGEVRTVGQNGAEDTIYTVDLTFLAPIVTELDSELCVGDFVTVGTQRFDENRPSGTVVLPGASAAGCDSTVVVDLSYAPGASLIVTGPEEICLDGSAVELTVEVDANGEGVTGTAVINGELVENYVLPEGRSTIELPGGTTDVNFRYFDVTAPGSATCDRLATPEPDYRPRASRMRARFSGPGGETALSACAGTPLAAIGVAVAGSSGPVTYDWSTGSTTQSITDVGPGAYELIVTDAIGCQLDTSVVVEEGISAPLSIEVIDPPCPGGQGTFVVEVGGDLADLTYSFDGADPVPLPPAGRLAFEDLAAGDFTLALAREGGCREEIALSLTDPPPVELIEAEEIVVDLGEEAVVGAELPPGATAITWTPSPIEGDAADEAATFRPGSDATVALAVLTDDGCRLRDSVRIVVRGAIREFLPNAFSPNDDGTNDTFAPQTAIAVERVRRMSIYDRWGERVFQATDFEPGAPNVGWNGRINNAGQEASSGVYVVLLEIELVGGATAEVTGDVTLLR